MWTENVRNLTMEIGKLTSFSQKEQKLTLVLWPCPAARWGDAEIMSSFNVLQHFVHWSTFLNMQLFRLVCCAVFLSPQGINTRGLLANLWVSTDNKTKLIKDIRIRKIYTGRILFSSRIHLSHIHLTVPERTGPDRQATLLVLGNKKHEWTIWSRCVDFGTTSTKVCICGSHDGGKLQRHWMENKYIMKMFIFAFLSWMLAVHSFLLSWLSVLYCKVFVFC